MIKNGKNNDSYDQQIEHLFTFEAKSKKTDNEKKPETLDESEIENYSHILYSIEFAAALHYVENPSTTDKVLLKELTSLVRRHSNGQSYVKSNIVKKAKTINVANANLRSTTMKNHLMTKLKQAAIRGLQEGPITREEFLLCLKYVMYCIDNRSWISGGKGYLDWIANWFGLLEGGKKQEFDSFYDSLSQIIGIEKDFLKDEHYS